MPNHCSPFSPISLSQMGSAPVHPTTHVLLQVEVGQAARHQAQPQNTLKSSYHHHPEIWPRMTTEPSSCTQPIPAARMTALCSRNLRALQHKQQAAIGEVRRQAAGLASSHRPLVARRAAELQAPGPLPEEGAPQSHGNTESFV